MAYITIEEFRNRTGLNTTDINDTLLQTYLNRGAEKIRDECYILRRFEPVSKNTVSDESIRYYLNYLYLADSNMDNVIDENDLQVIERNSDGTIQNDITTQVASINQYEGYFTLNEGYSSDNSYNIFVTYRWTRFPLAEIQDELEELNLAITMNYYSSYQITNVYKRGVSNISIPGLSVTRGYDAFENLNKTYKQIEKDNLQKLKPIRMLSWKGNTGVTQMPKNIGNPMKKENLGNNDDLSGRINLYYNNR